MASCHVLECGSVCSLSEASLGATQLAPGCPLASTSFVLVLSFRLAGQREPPFRQHPPPTCPAPVLNRRHRPARLCFYRALKLPPPCKNPNSCMRALRAVSPSVFPLTLSHLIRPCASPLRPPACAAPRSADRLRGRATPRPAACGCPFARHSSALTRFPRPPCGRLCFVRTHLTPSTPHPVPVFPKPCPATSTIHPFLPSPSPPCTLSSQAQPHPAPPPLPFPKPQRRANCEPQDLCIFQRLFIVFSASECFMHDL